MADLEVIDAEVIRTGTEWAEVIRADLGRAVEGIVSAGKHLIAAKADVQHGEWLPMLQQIGISKQVAARLMAVGQNDAIAKVPSSVLLPASLDALYALSRLAPEVIESGIEHGDIHPAMTIKDAKGYAQEVADRDAPANVNTDTGEIAEPPAPMHDTEKEVSIVNDLRLYLSHIGTDKAIRSLSPTAKQHIIAALESAATNLKETL